ncbi:hypothetical protein B0J13DRAFT_403821, partial [Dactylonectria estremocensis]
NTVHHQYFDRRLCFNSAFSGRNLLLHLPLEFACKVLGITLSWSLSHLLTPRPSRLREQDLALAVLLELGRSCVVAWNVGRDSNHVPYSQLPKDPHSILVGPQYHALHHIDPHNYFGSMVRLMDWVFGTAVTIRNRRVAMTGSRGALGQALTYQLEKEGAKCIEALRFGVDWNYGDYSALGPLLANTDILILAHGSKDLTHALQANCEASISIIEMFKRCRPSSKVGLLPEVWYVGSEAELHGSLTKHDQAYSDSKRAFVPFALGYYHDDGFMYRHIVPAAFKSRMGPALVSARWTARVTLWWISRGARYVPVTYTGIAFLNYVRFMYWVKP